MLLRATPACSVSAGNLRPRPAGRGDKAIYTKPTAAALPRPML
jgi:hypothetical protein